MELFHTSPSEITKINTDGLFGEFLCFSSDEYVMTAGQHVTYKIEIDEDEIVEANHLFYHKDAEKLEGLVSEVMEMLGCDEGTAEEMLSQNDDCGDAEMSWEIQAMTAKAAKILGYRGVLFQDEQGTCYMIDMMGYESELVKA
jgi:hypothetical protein